ncbi:hypothetical protein [Streptomyces collinus]|uniref:hypothetical protein n=1 Tax=Streptomyces collinus TaxID=42684 RepID=UPI0036371262
MPLGHTTRVKPDETREIFNRLQPHLPTQLQKVEPNPSGWGLSFVFTPFTGREPRPSLPAAFYQDPKLRYVAEDVDPAEHRLRELADHIVCDLYDRAQELWADAAYVADLRQVVRDAPERWRTYERDLKALQAAYAYLRTPEAAAEWPSALSRLIDAQARTMTAAEAFDDRAQAIVEVHAKHLHADLGRNAALERAGHPDAQHWHLTEPEHYHRGQHFFDTDVPLAEIVRRLIEQQDAHLAKVARLSGTTS